VNGVIGGLAVNLFDAAGKALWQGALVLLRGALTLVGRLGQINPSPGAGPISGGLWSAMLGLAAAVAVLLFFVQLIMAVLNPRRQMLQAVTGPVQYAIATAISTAIVLALLGSADGLSTVILASAHQSEDISGSLAALGLADNVDVVKGAVLGVMAVVGIIPLAIGYGITLLFRSAAIIVLIATLPITAAGLVAAATKHWFWRASRWLLALIFLKPTFALCFAIGAGVVKTAGQPPQNGAPGGTGVVTLLLGLGIMFIALFAPFALFRLFAFVEPGTQPHQTMMSAFGSAMAGAKQAGSGIANADVGSVFSGATGGRFGSSSGDGEGSGSSGSDDKKQAAATAALAAATGGTSAAAGAAGGAAGGEAGAASGAGSSAGSSSGAGSSAGSSSGGSMLGSGSGQGSSSGSGQEQEGSGDDDAELAGAGAAGGSSGAGSIPSGGAGGAGSSGASSSSGGAPGSSSGSGGSGSGSSGGSGSGSSSSGGSLAGAAAAALGPVGNSISSAGGGRVGAGASAAGSIGRGALGAGAQIAGYTPMPPAPHGGVGGPTHDPAATDYGGGPPPPPPSSSPAGNRYRDPSWDQPDDGDDDDGYDEGRMSGVI
jgi:hypothetical protein